MAYRSKDKTYMQELKTSIYRLEDRQGTDKSDSWEYIRRYTVIDDLFKFLRNANDNPNQVGYVYNANLVDVDYLFVTSTEHPKELEVFNAFIKARGITNYYRTSYSKSASPKIFKAESLISTLKCELNILKPKYIVIFGNTASKFIYDAEPPMHQLVNNVMVTSSIIQIIQSDVTTKNKLKNIMWSDFGKLL